MWIGMRGRDLTMLYTLYELTHAAMTPYRAAVNTTRRMYRSPFNPMAETLPGRTVAAAADLFEAVTRRYGKPEWSLDSTMVDGFEVAITPRVVWENAWCRLIHFERDGSRLIHARADQMDPKVLIVAPMSGHYATLLSGTVEAFLPEHEVYITDWADARSVPLFEGRFDLDDYIDYVRAMISALGPQTHVVAVCQPGPPTLAAIALMAEEDDPNTPATMTFMGSPIDARESPTVPNLLAEERPLQWFAENMIHTVPWPHPGMLRRVYPGFVQLAGFMNMNWSRHVDAHWSFFEHLVADDGDNAERHRDFYDEYLSVMDLTEEFYIQTIDRVFQRHLLARGLLEHRGRLVRPEKITRTALLTVEGEKDDISGIGQTQAAHGLCSGIDPSMKEDYVQDTVGHYGVFNGRRFRDEIRPRISRFIREHWDRDADRSQRLSDAGVERMPGIIPIRDEAEPST